ncbi:HEAT repeat domain-containing protein [Providencia rettgeri]|uniref:HEAT repeat domain-containing protein n=1 Tax=Providencia rettgeri TaxID=587 RepID=UPI001CA62744|nr:HEAT repeat domain-containing protein [Providencia rettgeri]QZY64949.1 HEAT repeat domain-containing protein [Providencia rettgeri]
MCDKNDIINSLTELTEGNNDEIKLVAISTLGDYKATIENEITLSRLVALFKDPNKDVAIASIKAISKLSTYFND